MEGLSMAIKFKLVERKNPQDLAAPGKYYARAVIKGKRTFRTMAERIANNSTMGVGDIYGVLLNLEQEISYGLEDGDAVELGDICTFRPAVQSNGVDTVADFNMGVHMKKKSVKIRGKRSFTQKMADVPLEREA